MDDQSNPVATFLEMAATANWKVAHDVREDRESVSLPGLLPYRGGVRCTIELRLTQPNRLALLMVPAIAVPSPEEFAEIGMHCTRITGALASSEVLRGNPTVFVKKKEEANPESGWVPYWKASETLIGVYPPERILGMLESAFFEVSNLLPLFEILATRRGPTDMEIAEALQCTLPDGAYLN